jgi:hypothetical protein
MSLTGDNNIKVGYTNAEFNYYARASQHGRPLAFAPGLLREEQALLNKITGKTTIEIKRYNDWSHLVYTQSRFSRIADREFFDDSYYKGVGQWISIYYPHKVRPNIEYITYTFGCKPVKGQEEFEDSEKIREIFLSLPGAFVVIEVPVGPVESPSEVSA